MEKNIAVKKSLTWSTFSEIGVKFVSPITNMILARLLAPSDFGVVAVCNMLISFVDLVTEAGFGKYLIQRQFRSKEEEFRFSDVAFWTNLAISLFSTLMIIVFRNQIATLLGSRSYAPAIAFSSLQLVLTSYSAIHLSLLRKNFDFKKLFFIRLIVSFIPLIITIPVAIIFKTYWALIIGNLSSALINSILLFCSSKYKPKFYYNFGILKEMFSFSFWSLCEALANWFIFWVDTFIVGRFFSDYYLGLYKNSANMVQSLMGMIPAAVSPVLLSSLAKLKADNKEFIQLFIKTQKLVLLIIIPLGVGIFIFRHLITLILLGNKWIEAENIIGCWGLMLAINTVFYSIPAEAYKALGKPRILFSIQLLYLLFLIPALTISARFGFWTFVYVRCYSVIVLMLISSFYTFKVLKIKLSTYYSTFLIPGLIGITLVLSYFLLNNLIGLRNQIALCLIEVGMYLVFALITIKFNYVRFK